MRTERSGSNFKTTSRNSRSGNHEDDRDRADVKPITLLSCHAFIVITLNQQGSIFMLFLTAILRVWLPPEPEPHDLLARTRLRLGHLGLTVIALVFILVTFWQR
jgi:hypothetical protein